jgi:hypothetical protein
MAIINLPPKLNKLLNEESKDYKNNSLATIVQNNFVPFRQILERSDLYFFPDYTDHSIHHVEAVLLSIENLITDATLESLSPTDIGVLVTAVVLHDIGMLTSAEMFKNMIRGEYDNISDNWFKDEPTWKELWEDYLKDSQYWNAETRKNNTGDPNYVVKVSNKGIDEETDEETITYKISHPLHYDERDRRFIGEFIRKHHARLAYEVALNGYIGNKRHCFATEDLPSHFMQLSGLIARSHGINVRDTFDILKKKFGSVSWNRPGNIQVILLMILVRLADLLQINPERTNKILINLRTIYSPFSLKEHEMHLSINCVQIDNDDPELIVVQATPQNAEMYVKIENTIQYIQYEFDHSWAILGEVYGNRYQLLYRRIISNISDEEVKNGYDYVPKQFGFKFNNALPKLLIAPLYGDDPSFGVRELIQNAVDACRARMAFDKDYNNLNNFTHVTVTLDPEKKLFRIEDSGIGMTLKDIEQYFLTIGSSYDRNVDWQKAKDKVNTTNENGMIEDIKQIYRTGHFGIGILAAFLLGPIITVKTKSLKSKQGYEFTLSLDVDFIQIKKNENLPIGTTIEIEFDNLTLERLNNSSVNWTDWYIDPKPRIEYYYNGSSISNHNDIYSRFKKLSFKSSDYGEIFWKPINIFSYDFFFDLQNSNHKLYCNGFFITKQSNKTKFSLLGTEKYIPLEVPSLIMSDLNNKLALNLQRDNINVSNDYAFEKELAIDMYKDYLCQLLSIDLDALKYSHILFFNQSGYTINTDPYFPYFPHVSYENYLSSNKRCLAGKTLVHVYGDSSFNLRMWRDFFDGFPNAFFTFSGGHKELSYQSSLISNEIIDVFLLRGGLTRSGQSLNKCMIAIEIDSFKRFIKQSTRSELIPDLIEYTDTFYSYAIINADTDKEELKLAKALINQINFLYPDDAPSFFIIHKNDGNNIESEFDDFINEYANGNLIIPYDNNARKERFKKIYEECSEDIEKYQVLYNRNRKDA